MTVRTLLIAAALLLTQARTALAQDRPLFEPFRIGYVASEPIAERLRASAALERALWRKGFVVAWRAFESGIGAIRALHTEDIDLALDLSLSDVIAAKRENLKMVFISELRSIAPSCCDVEELFFDHTFKRYTLSSEYFADQREDILSIVHQEIIRSLQQPPEHLAREQANLGPIPVAHTARPSSAPHVRVALVTRKSMEQTVMLSEDASAAPVDIADVNYWRPR